MSTTLIPLVRPTSLPRDAPQRRATSIPAALLWLVCMVFGWVEICRQRDRLADLADDRHLMDDIGLTREQALDEASKPFWH